METTSIEQAAEITAENLKKLLLDLKKEKQNQ